MAMRRTSVLTVLGLSCALGAGGSLAVAQSGWEMGIPSRNAVDERLVAARGTLERDRARKVEIQAELSTLSPRKSELRQRLVRDGRSLYRVSRGGLLPVAGGMDALLGHASRVSRMQRMVHGELASLHELDRKGTLLRKEAAEIELRLSAAEGEVRALEQARVGLAQQQQTQALFEAAFASPAPSARPEGDRIQYGLSIIGGSAQERFLNQRGNLALPVSGPSSIQDASRAESDGPGLELGASSGAAVRAAAGGRVAFADRYGSYGELVILDHGDRYYTVYGGLGRVEVQVGDELSKSARIGTASGSPVYFEVRRGTKTQDARAWLGL